MDETPHGARRRGCLRRRSFSPEVNVVVRPPPQLGVEGVELSSAGHEHDPDLALERHGLGAASRILFALDRCVRVFAIWFPFAVLLRAGSSRGGA